MTEIAVVEVLIPTQPAVVEVQVQSAPALIEVREIGLQGPPGPQGIAGPPGAEPDVPTLSLIFENQLL